MQKEAGFQAYEVEFEIESELEIANYTLNVDSALNAIVLDHSRAVKPSDEVTLGIENSILKAQFIKKKNYHKTIRRLINM